MAVLVATPEGFRTVEVPGLPVAPQRARRVLLVSDAALLDATLLGELVKADEDAHLRNADGEVLAVNLDETATQHIHAAGVPLPADPMHVHQLRSAAHSKRVHTWIRRGVRIFDPNRVHIGEAVRLEPGVILWPDVTLTGATRIAAGAELRPGCWVSNSQIGPRALIKPHCVIEQAAVGADAQVGPMAHLRPGAVLEDQVKVGNFVEVKKAILHTGAKASHLSYIGDAEVGANANVGAGTITCNYDGYNKHKTVIGEGAFIGSNTALVAPVRVGKGAIVGAGSVVTRSVPDDALTVERADQRILEGKAAKIHARNKRIKQERSGT